ncbi:unnamed protein product (macronuclear) [Paramecium tetraurelia]|uniref:Uncharacterized protein n=1 Tax=Paramecium tetraurelia TaxID=5888 RepID=A0D5U7_PARTE|nr:uncharacterized protein GSPATT00013844001 [Paramecium tetraurelia]CAK78414.1 unnamed protein product [Paramecium tetraurelia]|eukprot:XP_001445811.1 hypothetical protein (macronuclear) [Paramecium tetraurelia strain d4-2]
MNKYQLLKNHIQQLIRKPNTTNILFVRHGQTNQNLSNTICGWTDSRLTIRGREQANQLLQALLPFRDQFKGVYTSDLRRAKETAQISLGFPHDTLIIEDPRLRELNFGKHENIAYSMLDQETKDIIFTFQYQAPGGETWQQTQERAMKLIREKCTENGSYLMYSHGGQICSITYNLGLQNSIGNCSCVGLEYDQQKKEMKELLFKWDFPEEENEQEI